MSNFVALPSRLWIPDYIARPNYTPNGANGGFTVGSIATLDAANEKIAMIGEVFWVGRPTTAKTFSSAGAKIGFRANTTTHASASTTLRIGIQDVASSGVAIIQPDGVWTDEPYKDCVGGGADAIVSTSWNEISIASGSRSIAHGDLIAVVFDMTARGGSDSIPIIGTGGSYNQMPAAVADTGAGWALGAASYQTPNVLLFADDGTLGVLNGAQCWSGSSGALAFNDSSAQDEYGTVFRVPFRCKIDCISMSFSTLSADADATFYVYSDPYGTPSSLGSAAYLGEWGSNNANERSNVYMLDSEITLEANTDYCLACRATGSADINRCYIPVYDMDYLAAMGMDGWDHVRRNGGSGAFGNWGTNSIGIDAVGISAIDVGSLLTHPGMGGGARG